MNIFRKIAERVRTCVEDSRDSGYFERSYSQEGEDMILRRIFETVDGGFYVDVGAHHPKRFSNTYLFYKRGWSGINIDATPGSMRIFDVGRPRDLNIEAAVADERGSKKFFLFNEPALNSFDEELSRSRVGDRYRIVEEKIIETVPLREVFRNHLPEGKRICFLTVDVEGLDVGVLRSNDWSAYRPEYVLIEGLGLNIAQAMGGEVCRFLDHHGYEFFAKTVSTLFFRDRSTTQGG